MLRTLERCYAVAMLFYMSNGIFGFITGNNEAGLDRPGSGMTFLILQTVFYMPLLLLILLRWKRFIRGLILGRWVVALSLLAIGSVLWCSDTQSNSVVLHSAALLGTTFYGVYLGITFNGRDQLKLYTWTFTLILVLSIGFAILLPEYGVDHYFHAGKWQGIFTQKNLLGKAMLMSVLVFLAAKNIVPLWMRGLCIAASAVVALLSGSKTALLIALPILLLIPAYRVMQMQICVKLPILLAALATMTVIAAAALTHISFILRLLGRDATLTGRAELWRALRLEIASHWLLGYGYGAFWGGMNSESANVILALGWAPKHAHNGILDLLLDLGVIGLVLFGISYAKSVVLAFRPPSRRLSGEWSWPLFYLAFTCLYYLTEGQMVRQNSIYWVMYVATVIYVASPAWKETARVRRSNAFAIPSVHHDPHHKTMNVTLKPALSTER